MASRPELEDSLRQRRLRSGQVPPAQQPRHAKRPLQGVFQVVVERVHRLVIPVMAGKTLDRPAKYPWHKQEITARKQSQIRPFALPPQPQSGL